MKRGLLVVLVVAMLVFTVFLTGCETTELDESPNESTVNEEASEQGEEPETSFPEDTVTIIVPWPAGGFVDLFARQLAEAAQEETGVSFIVQNNVGAKGTIAATQYLESANDGYTVLLTATPPIFYQPYLMDVSYSSKDYTPIIGLNKIDLFLVVPSSSGIETMDEFVAAVKDKEMNWGSSGPGTIDYIAQQTMADALDITPKNVSFSGNADIVTAILGGNLDCACAITSVFEQYVISGDLNVLGNFSDRDIELEGIGTVPSINSMGYDVNTTYNYYFILAQNGTDPVIVDKLYQIFSQTLESDSVKKYIEQMQYTMLVKNPSEMQEYFDVTSSDTEKMLGDE